MKLYVIIGNSLLILFFILFLSFAAYIPTANAVDWTPMQKLWRGMVEEKRMTTCRLAKRKVVKEQKICLYEGANKTRETIFVDKFEQCPRTLSCVYEPDKDAPSILEMMESLEESLK
jgi:hypothetical protein